MTRVAGLIERLEAAGVLSAVDAALGRLLARGSAGEDERVGLIAALASAALAEGHSCLPLPSLHEFVRQRRADAASEAADGAPILSSIALPSTDQMRDALNASSWVAQDGDRAAALVLDAHDRVYLRRYFNYERTIADALLERTGASEWNNPAHADLRATLADYFGKSVIDDDQQIAVLLALRARFLIITGGPGAGKTSTVLRVLAITLDQALSAGQAMPRIALAAPTGKAAARLSETLRAPLIPVSEDVRAALPAAAMTLHRLLGVMPGRARPRYDRSNPLPFDLVVVDEASMLDLSLAARLCDALAPASRLILLGDRDQLASVEAGSVFGALCAASGEANRFTPPTTQWLQSILLASEPGSGRSRRSDAEIVDAEITPQGFALARSAELGSTPSRVAEAPDKSRGSDREMFLPLADALVELRNSHRFGEQSAIGRFARAVRAGADEIAQDILLESHAELRSQRVHENALGRTVIEQVVPRFEALATATSAPAALDQLERFRVLCALREGPFGAATLGAMVENELRRRSLLVDAQGWFAGRLVMIRSNDYAQGLFNGDIGVTLPSGRQGEFEVWLRHADGTPRAIPTALLPAHEGAFALTVHKAQGSEFNEVLIVLPARDARVLSRELLYTAVTRARNKVELWTSGEILAATLSRKTLRWSGLADALREPLR